MHHHGLNPESDLRDWPARLRNLVEEELEADETIVWVGQPLARRFVLRSLPRMIMGIPFAGFALFWIGGGGFNVPLMFLVLLGFWMMLSPFLELRRAKNTAYVLTDRRAIIVRSGRSTVAQSCGPEVLKDTLRRERADGSGDLNFDTTIQHIHPSFARTSSMGFVAIPNVKDVEKLARDIARTAQA